MKTYLELNPDKGGLDCDICGVKNIDPTDCILCDTKLVRTLPHNLPSDCDCKDGCLCKYGTCESNDYSSCECKEYCKCGDISKNIQQSEIEKHLCPNCEKTFRKRSDGIKTIFKLIKANEVMERCGICKKCYKNPKVIESGGYYSLKPPTPPPIPYDPNRPKSPDYPWGNCNALTGTPYE